MARPKAVQTQKLNFLCESCGEEFSGRKSCPNCGETVSLTKLNADGVPIDDVAASMGLPRVDIPLQLGRTQDVFNIDYEMEAATQQEFKDVIREANLDKVKTLRAERAAKLLRAEQELKATEKGFLPPSEDVQQAQQQPGTDFSSSMFLQALGGWDPEQREMFLDHLASNPQIALTLSMMMNPGKTSGQMPMMNPMGMMGMMQPPTAPAPEPVDAATMVTAMISGMQALKEMSGDDGGNNAQMERILDKMDEMRKETESLKLKLIEERNSKPAGVSREEISLIISDALSKNSEQRANIKEGVGVLSDLKSLKEGMVDLGLMQEVSKGDLPPTLEQQKFDYKKQQDEKREKREHELALKAEDATIAKSNVQAEFISNLFGNVPQEAEPEQRIDGDDLEPVGETCAVKPATSVIS